MAEVSWGDLAAQAEDALTPIPSGEYPAVITKAEIKFASTGKKMFSISAKITAGPHVNRMFWNNFTVSPDNPNAMLVFFRQMSVFGMSIDFFKSLPPDGSGDGAIPQALMGKPFTARLSIRSYQGTDSNQLEAVLPPTTVTGAAPVPAVTPGPQPVAAQPVVAQPAPVQSVPVPGVPSQEAPPQPQPAAAAAPSVEELQAQLAALQAANQAQQAPTPQPEPASPVPTPAAEPVATTDWASQAQAVPNDVPAQPVDQSLGQQQPNRPF